MELKWLEDFVSLADTLNFSRSAEERNVTQPAFSRRIRSLETWLGTDLINRSSYPISLTPAGKIFRDVAEELLAKAYSTRKLLRGETSSSTTVRLAAPQALILGFLSKWIMEVSREFGSIVPRVTATNTYEALFSLVEGQSCDFAIVYHHPQIPVALPENRYPYLHLANEQLIPVSRADALGQPVYRLTDDRTTHPYVAYPSSLFMGQIVDFILTRTAHSGLRKCFETDLLEAAKAMITSGHGIGWVPKSMVADDLAAGTLAVAGPAVWMEPIEVRLYFALDNRRPLANELWEFLCRTKREAIPAADEMAAAADQAGSPAASVAVRASGKQSR